MKKLYEIIDSANLDWLGVTAGDVVEKIGRDSSAYALCQPVTWSRSWSEPRIAIPVQNLREVAPVAVEQSEIPRISAQEPPTSPSNGQDRTEVPPEEKTAPRATTAPSTGTSHDSHYASMPIEPVTISEMMMEVGAIPPRARLHAAKSVEYLTRAGRKEGQEWEKEFQKALNHLHRAIYGKWPWETRDH